MIRQGTLRAQFNSDLMEKLRNLNEYRSKKILDQDEKHFLHRLDDMYQKV